MPSLKQLFANNLHWANTIKGKDPDFFLKLSKQQAPEFLWIGCADSRVPANEIVGLLPGELFVHRNVANVVPHTDFNCLSVLQYAVEVLHVKHIIVCGHYGCGGVHAAMGQRDFGLIDNWLRSIKDIYCRHRTELEKLGSVMDRLNRMCELNVMQQVRNVSHTTIVQHAWKRGQALTVSGWIYSIEDGILKDLNVGVDDYSQISEIYRFLPENPKLSPPLSRG